MAKKRKIKYKNIFKLLFIVLLIIVIIKLLSLNITNIYISGNNTIKDIDIINIAKLSDYPKVIKVLNFNVEKRLKMDKRIYDAKVYKKFTKIYIEIVENRPLFYNSNTSHTVMLDGSLDDNIVTPYLLNYVPDTIYDSFVKAISLVNEDVLSRISEIEYKPNNVDDSRFYLKMNDGNYVYITLYNFNKINNYIEMLKQFKNKKGILYLDSGEYFEIKN